MGKFPSYKVRKETYLVLRPTFWSKLMPKPSIWCGAIQNYPNSVETNQYRLKSLYPYYLGNFPTLTARFLKFTPGPTCPDSENFRKKLLPITLET